MLTAEKNRLQSPSASLVRPSVIKMIDLLQTEIQEIPQQIQSLIDSIPVLKEPHTRLKTIPGIGPVIAAQLLVLMPELGHLSRREVASLAGLAPIANDSGRKNAYRRTGYGRQGIKPLLFLAAMAARNTKNSCLRLFYDRLISNGNPKMVPLTALARKILTIANAKIKSHLFLIHG